MASLNRLAVPEPGTPEYDAFKEFIDSRVPSKAQKRVMKRLQNEALALVSSQSSNGAGHQADEALREFHHEFNSRTGRYGLNSLPSSFLILEAFFSYIPPLGVFRLLPETDHRFSWVEFLDTLTGAGEALEDDVTQALPDGQVFHFSNSDGVGEFTLADERGQVFGFQCASLVRRGAEVVVFASLGLEADLDAESARIREEGTAASPARAYLEQSDQTAEAVDLDGTGRFWRVLSGARFDLRDRSKTARFLMFDRGDSYFVASDNVDLLSVMPGGVDGAMARANVARLESLRIAFEFSTAALHLPSYFQRRAGDVTVDRAATEYAELAKHADAEGFKRWIPAAEKALYRNVSVLPRRSGERAIPESDLRTPALRVETSGYWKALDPGKTGTDRQGQSIRGRTWVDKQLTWLESDDPPAVLTTPEATLPDGPDPGWIYVMRSAAHPGDVFKVGLTRRTPEERARELSGTGSPDVFLVVHRWPAADCAEAEGRIHAALDAHRVNPRREFFRVSLERVVEVVNGVLAGAD